MKCFLKVFFLIFAMLLPVSGYAQGKISRRSTPSVSSPKQGNGKNQPSKEVYVDLGLPSGTLWKATNESGFYDYGSAVRKFDSKLPTLEQWEELKDYCAWKWTGKGYKVLGDNGKSIFLSAAGYRDCNGDVLYVGTDGSYWSSSPSDSEAWSLYFDSDGVDIGSDDCCGGRSIRLVQVGSMGNRVLEQERQAEEARIKAEQERQAILRAQGYVDLGLPSGTLWKATNESGFYDYDSAVRKYGSKLPTQEQLVELKNTCQWTWKENGYEVRGLNGNFIFLPAAGYRNCSASSVSNVGSGGSYWSSKSSGSEGAWELGFDSGKVGLYSDNRCYGQSVRLVQDK